MTQQLTTIVEPFTHVHFYSINPSIDRLWHLAWETLSGESTWNKLGDNPHTFFVTWVAYRKKFSIQEIHGKLRDDEYRIQLGRGSFRLILTDAVYQFWDTWNAANASVPGGSYLQYASAVYSLRSEAINCKDWLNSPYGDQGSPKSYAMTQERADEVTTFIDDLVDVISRRKNARGKNNEQN